MHPNKGFAREVFGMSRVALTEICSYRTESGPIDPLTYISTESMFPNRAGIITASSIPATGKAV